MSSFVFAVIVALICAGPKNSQARTEGKYVVSNSDLDCPIDPWTNVLKIILMTTLFDFFLALQRRNMSILSIQATWTNRQPQKVYLLLQLWLFSDYSPL